MGNESNGNQKREKKILLVANVAKEHINKFHIPTIKAFIENGWITDVACSGDAEVPFCSNQYKMCWKRNPFSFETLRGIRDLKNILKTNHYDVVYCHTPVGGLVARLAAKSARKSGTKVIYCAHGFHFFRGAPLTNWLIYYPIEKWLAHFTDTVFTVNREDYERASKRFTKKTQVVLVPEVGVNFERLKVSDSDKVRRKYREELGFGDDVTVLIYVAELIPNKNQKMLIDALKLLLDKGEKVSLLLPGPDHYDGEIEKYAHSLKLDDNVVTLGWRSDIGELMHSADICTASSIREGFGINLIEAMYCGLPVIATKNRGHEMIINNEQNGFLVELNDVEAMADRVSQLIHNKDLYKSMAETDVSEYDCNKVALRLYDEINKRVN